MEDFFRRRIDAGSAHLARFEQVKRFTLLPEEFTQAAGELTPTLKLRRRQIEEHFADEIAAMYDA